MATHSRFRALFTLAAMVGIAVAAPARSAVLTGGPGRALFAVPAFGLRLLSLPLPAFHRDRVPTISSHDGRSILRFIVDRSVTGLYVRINGSVEFERADIQYADGHLESVDAFGLMRDDGVFKLATFDGPRDVAWVRLVMCSRSRHAKVDVAISA